MALAATVRRFALEISDVDRGVYESLDLEVAQHPSESAEYLVARVLAYALEHCEGLVFTNGLYEADEPALWVRDLTGRLEAWIEIGTPEAARLHKASKASDRVAVYCHKDPGPWLRRLTGARVHASEQIALVSLPVKQIGLLAERLERRNVWAVSRMEGTIYVAVGDDAFEVEAVPLAWPG